MKNLGSVTDPKDLTTKEYVDGVFGETVLHTEQSLTEEQKEQARVNIGLPIIESAGGDTLTWDGDTEGLTTLSGWAKISDDTLVSADFASGYSVSSMYEGSVITQDITTPFLSEESNCLYIYTEEPATDGSSMPAVTIAYDGATVEKGIYFMDLRENLGIEMYIYRLTINGYTGFTSTKIKEEYLPAPDWNNLQNIPIIDYVVEQGTSGIWTYRKWNSGIAECWGTTASYYAEMKTSWGNLYCCDNAIASIAYPFEFKEIPVLSITPYRHSGHVANYWLYTGNSLSTATATPTISAIRPTSSTAYVGAYLHARGRWK